jgi:hypothetical protein
MFGSVILDIAIGLIFVYLLLSLVCSAAKELLESLMRHRASDLERGIQDLLGPALAAGLYNHGLIKGLSKAGELPSYIPAQTFALALLDGLVPATAVAPSGASGALATPPTAAGSAPTAPPPTLRGAVAAIANTDVRNALLSLIDAAGPDAAKVRANIEGWFNSGMDRVTGWYARRTQKIIIVLGLLITLALNVDSVQIANSLYHDSALRDSLVAAAQEYAKSPPPAAAAGTPATKPIANITAEISKLGLPIGWPDPQWNPDAWQLGLLRKIFGLLLTTLAISLGAPFWFDLLGRVINVRASIKPDQ